MKLTVPLITNAAVTGSPVVISEGGLYLFLANGTFTGATATLQILSTDGTTYITVPNSSMTVAGALNVELPAGCTVRGALTGGTPTAMYASLGYVRQ